MSERKICIACNEDGFGPSVFAFFLVKALIEKARSGHYGINLKIQIINKSAYDFNEPAYQKYKEFVKVISPDDLKQDSLIQLPKPHGEVHVRETLKTVIDYDLRRREYFNELKSFLSGAAAVVDIGVPMFVHAAKRLGIPHRFTLFDHSWAETLRLICAPEWQYLYRHNLKATQLDRDVAEILASLIEKDEQHANEVYLFDQYITPPVFVKHWEKLGIPITFLNGVLGGIDNPDSLKQTALEILNRMLEKEGQKPVPEGKELIMISPGGTPVWAGLLPNLVGQLVKKENEEKDYTVVLSNPKGESKQATEEMRLAIAKHSQTGGKTVRYYGVVEGEPQQVIMPAFDLVITRAGGGTVNDAFATETPLVCVEEPQVQIKLIEEECLRFGYIPNLPETRITEFEERPIECLDTIVKARRIKVRVKKRAEDALAEDILCRIR